MQHQFNENYKKFNKIVFTYAIIVTSTVLFLKLFFFPDTIEIQLEANNKLQIDQYYSQLNSIPIVKKSNTVDNERDLDDLYDRLLLNTLFNKNGFPESLNLNLIETEDENIEDLTNEQRRQLFQYRSMLSQKYNVSEHGPLSKTASPNSYLEKMNMKIERPMPEIHDKIPEYCNNRIDVVWTYVDGNKNLWKKDFDKYKTKFEKNLHQLMKENQQFNKKEGNDNQKDDEKMDIIDMDQYIDDDLLKYSMRSVQQHVPFDIHWHLIVQNQDQIPSFIDKSTVIYYNEESTPGSLRIIYHKDFIPSDAKLPTFNPNAIEASFAYLKGINECFIYLNDDFLINSDISISNIFDESGKLYVYKNPQFVHQSPQNLDHYESSLYYSNNHFNQLYDDHVNRNSLLHHCYFFRMSALKKINKLFEKQFSSTRKQRIVNHFDMSVPFIHGHYLLREGYANEQYLNKRLYNYFSLSSDTEDISSLIKSIKQQTIPFIVINNKYSSKNDKTDTLIHNLKMEMEKIYPSKTPFEL